MIKGWCFSGGDTERQPEFALRVEGGSFFYRETFRSRRRLVVPPPPLLLSPLPLKKVYTGKQRYIKSEYEP